MPPEDQTTIPPETPTIDQSSPAAPASSAAPTTEPSAPAAALGFDDAEYQAALAEEAAEIAAAAAATAAAGQQPAPDATSPAPGTAPTPAGQPAPVAAKPQPIMVPIGRLNDALRQRREVEVVASRAQADAAYFRGQAEALAAARTAPTATTPAQPPTLTPQQELQQIRAAGLALAKRVDAFEITAVDAEKERQRLADLEWTVRAKTLAPPPAPTSAPVRQDDLYLSERTAELETKHPYSMHIPPDHPIWQTIEWEAANELRSAGVQFPPAGTPLPADIKLRLRERCAARTDYWGPLVVPGAVQPTGQPPGPQGPGSSPTAQPPAAPTTAQARAAKLVLAGTHPIDVHNLGQGAGGVGELTDAQIEAMTEEEIMKAMPKAVMDRYLNNR